MVSDYVGIRDWYVGPRFGPLVLALFPEKSLLSCRVQQEHAFSEMIGYRTQALQEHVVRKVGKVVQVERKAS